MVQLNDYTKFIQLHDIQLKSANIPEFYWQTLYIKLKNQVFDSNESFALLQIDYDGEVRTPEDPLWIVQIKNEEGLKHNDEKHIYLVDHAWTFRVNQAKQQLEQIPELLERMCGIMGINYAEHTITTATEQVCNLMWKYCHTYSIANAENIEDRLPIWYIMDELGCGIRHSDDPNFRAVPFFYIPEQITYTLIFPVKDVDYEEIVTRDFIEGVSDNLQRKAQLIPWVKSDLTDVNFDQNEPDDDYFLLGHVRETLPPIDLEIKMPDKIKVYSEYSMINKYLNHERFELTDNEKNADILWYTRHFKSYAELSETPNKFVNQFPFENILTIKDLLSIVCRRKTKSDTPIWYPITYNLKTELPKFISYFQFREKNGLDNHWICKPWNLARSLDTHITNNLDYIVRLPVTGPKIAQKYIENPVLFNRPEIGRVKFDVRYVILLKSTFPLNAYIYNNFFLRFSNKAFDLSDFHDYEKHFTVMNYSEETQLHHLPCVDFLKQWDEQYPAFTWCEIEKLIIKMLRDVFEGAVSLPPPRGIPSSPQSRAVYAADIILSWDNSTDRMQPKLLEINWTPDCKRACDYYPDFYNDIFSCLFLNDLNTSLFTSL